MIAILAALCCAVLALSSGAANMLSAGDFETWNDAKSQPAGADWRWSFSQRGTNGFAVCELSEAERHGGRTSLHLKDANSGNFNHVMWYNFSDAELKPMAGKTVRASAWIKQVFASNPPLVGISLLATDVDGKSVEHHNGTGTPGATDWVNVQVKVKMPEKPRSASLRFNCANGFGNVGEMYIDDVVVSPDPADHPALALRPPSADSLHALELPASNDTPEESAYRKGWREQPPKEEDGRARPEIRNGTWYMGARPEFYLGVWLYNTDMQWGPKCNPLNVDHPAYTKPPSKELFVEMGFNSSQISSAHALAGLIVRGFPLPRRSKTNLKGWKEQDADIARFFGRFGDMPMVMDFAFGYDKVYKGREQTLLAQRKVGTSWHSFVPFCPHSPEGWRYYRDYFLGGTRAAMRNGCNVFMYELFNESAWNDMCRYSVIRFAREMKARYGTIAAANDTWGTAFDSFAEVASQSDLKQFRGVWYDWCKFTSKCYCELLRKGAEVVRSADRRSRIYFTEQEAGVPATHRGQDYRDIAEALDVLAIEGGWQYGFKTDYKAQSEMEAVVASARSRHFFNCDFYQALAKGRKPVVNDEHYCTRFEDGKRVPSHRSDYITSMWLEVMHGVSSSFIYVWDKRYWEANTPEKAYANVVNPSYKSSSLLNPYNVKPEDLCAFKMFREELEPYKDKVLPFPRTKPATVAVYYSKATEIHRDSLPSRKGRPEVSDWYAAILHANFPCRVVFDDGIESLGPEVVALVMPVAECNPPSVAAAARAFQSRGGLVLADEEAFRYDEYRKPVPPETSFVRVKDPSEAVAKLLAADVKRYAVLEPADGGGPIAASDAQVIDRGDFKLVCCAAMQERTTRRVKLRLANLLPTSGPLTVWDVAAKRFVGNGGRDTWTAAELAEGVSLELPPQERVVLVLSASNAQPAPRSVDVVEDVQTPECMARTARGTKLLDFGKAAFGGVEVDFGEGEYEVRIGEKLDSQGGVDMKPGGTIRAASVRGSSRGNGFERVPLVADERNTRGVNGRTHAYPIPEKFGVVMPFRYVEVVKSPGDVAAANVRRTVLHWPIDMAASSFKCTDARLEKVYEFCKYSIWATSFAGVYVDGDRERIPYEADAYINQLGHYAIDADFEMGRRTFDYLMDHPTWPTEWAQHMIMMAWADWMYSGSTNLIAKHYARLKGEKLLLNLAREDGLLVSFPDHSRPDQGDIVDWPVGERDGFVFRPVNAVVNAFHYRNLREMRDIAEALGKGDDAAFYGVRAEIVRRSFDKAFYRRDAGLYADGEGTDHASLHANAAALAFGLVPEERKARVADFLVAKGMACSVYFAQYLLEALFEAGRDEAAIALMTAEGDRSWLGMMAQGSTVTMEAWSLRVKSNQDWNHAWGAVPLNIISRYILGVKPTSPGFKTYEVRPASGSVKVSGTVPTVGGPIIVGKVGTDPAKALERWGQTPQREGR